MPAPSEIVQQVSSEKRQAKETLYQVFCTSQIIHKFCLQARPLVAINNIKNNKCFILIQLLVDKILKNFYKQRTRAFDEGYRQRVMSPLPVYRHLRGYPRLQPGINENSRGSSWVTSLTTHGTRQTQHSQRLGCAAGIIQRTSCFLRIPGIFQRIQTYSTELLLAIHLMIHDHAIILLYKLANKGS